MVWGLFAFCLFAAARAAAPPAMISLPMRPGASSAVAVVPQMPGADVGNVATVTANRDSIAQNLPQLRGRQSMVPGYGGWTGGQWMESLRSTSPTSSDVGEAQLDHQQASHNPTASATVWAIPIGALSLVVAAVAGAVAGVLWSYRRAQVVKSKDSGAEMTASSSRVWYELPEFTAAVSQQEKPSSLDCIRIGGETAAARGDMANKPKFALAACSSETITPRSLAGRHFSSLGAQGFLLQRRSQFRGAKAKRLGRTPTVRRVTLEELKEVSMAQIPMTFRKLQTPLGFARRNKLMLDVREQIEENTYFMFTVCSFGIGMQDIDKLRNTVPPGVQIRWIKSTIVGKAVEGGDWAPFAAEINTKLNNGRVRGPHFYVFVSDEEDLKETVVAYNNWVKSIGRTEQLVAHNEENPEHGYTATGGGIMRDEFKYIPPEDIPKFANFPTKKELIGQVAGSIKQVTTKVARATKQLGQKTAIGTKKIVEKMEEEGLATVAEAAV